MQQPHAAHQAGDACMRDRHHRCALDLHASVLRPLRPQSEGACLATSLPPVGTRVPAASRTGDMGIQDRRYG